MQSLDKVRELVLSKYKDQHQNRLNHILGVVEMASYLSYIYNINKDKAMIAAYMHDYCKYDDINEIKKLLSNEEISECEKYPFVQSEVLCKTMDALRASWNFVYPFEN